MTDKDENRAVIVGIGANLPRPGGTGPLETCLAALQSLDGVAGLRLAMRSRWYVSTPVPPSGQPDYVNGAALLEGDADPAVLLAALQEIEAQFGRQRSVANAARTLDLDIVAAGGLVRTGPDPVIPHPRMHERAFVLMPLLDVAPDWRHPVLGRDARALLDALPPQGVRPLTSEADGPVGLRDGGSAIR